MEDVIRLTCPEHARDFSERLVSRFGSFGDVLAALPQDRASVLGDSHVVERTFQCIRSAISHILRERLIERPVISSEQSVLDYLKVGMAFDRIERFRVLFLNSDNRLIADEIMAVGTVSKVHAYPREVIRRCLDLGATAILLVHNHPSGNPMPSRADRELTEQIAQAARCFEVVLHDHLVIAKGGSLSFRKAGYL